MPVPQNCPAIRRSPESGQLLTCLDIFSDVGLLHIERLHKYISIQLTPGREKADLGLSKTMQILLHLKES